MIVVVVLVGNANTMVRVCKMMGNEKSKPEIKVEGIVNRR